MKGDVSEMGASRLDPENGLVNSETIEREGEGDVILEIDREDGEFVG
jgi:hypothetical protein